MHCKEHALTSIPVLLKRLRLTHLLYGSVKSRNGIHDFCIRAALQDTWSRQHQTCCSKVNQMHEIDYTINKNTNWNRIGRSRIRIPAMLVFKSCTCCRYVATLCAAIFTVCVAGRTSACTRTSGSSNSCTRNAGSSESSDNNTDASESGSVLW